jgi:dTDP-glucose 4,6-dehydratase
VKDHAVAVEAVLKGGVPGQIYNIGGNNEWKNIDIVHLVCDLMDERLGRTKGESRRLITFVKDRPGHDLRYAIDCGKIEKELGWLPEESFETGIRKTIHWYLEHQDWVDRIKTGAYLEWIESHYQMSSKMAKNR